jgi:hypothetical protein
LREEKTDYLLVAAAMMVVFFLLYSFSFLDDNTLTSWFWVFLTVDAKVVAALVLLGILAAFVLSRMQSLEEHPAPLLFLFSFVAGALFWRAPEVIIDASRYFTYAKSMAEYGVLYFLREWGGEINPWTDLPAVPFLYGLIFRFLGESRSYVQLFNTLLFSSTVVIIYMLGARLWSRSTGFCAGLLLLAAPYLYTQVPLMLVDIATMFLLTLAVFATVEALERKSPAHAILASLAIFLSFYSKFSSWIMLSVVLVIFFMYRKDPRSMRMAGLVTALSLALIGTVFLFKMDVLTVQLELLRTYQRPMLSVWQESHVSTFFYQVHPAVSLAALFSAYAAYRRRDSSYLMAGWLLILVLLIDVRRIRYLMPVFPMLALAAAYGLREVKQGRLRRFIACSAAASSIAIAVFAYLPFLESISAVNLMEAGRVVDALEQDDVAVYTPPPQGGAYNPAVAVPIFDLFTHKKIIYTQEKLSPPERAKRSPLRFTWEYRAPRYYEARSTKESIVVVISQDFEPLPASLEQVLGGYILHKEFYKKSRRPYLYRTMVRIYLPTSS